MATEKLTEEYTLRYVISCRDEAEQAKLNRMSLNKDNFAAYQLEHDFMHKIPGQSKEVLSKVRNATEQIKSFFQQALADLDDWWRVVPTDEGDGASLLIKTHEIQKLMNFLLRKADYFSHVGNSCQSGLLGSLAVSKVRGEMVPKPKFSTKKEGRGKSYVKHVMATDDKTWELRFDDTRQENWFPDPTGAKLYEIENCLLDLHIVKALAEGEDAIYDKAEVEKLRPWGGDQAQDEKKARETGQNTPGKVARPRVKITEFWGTIVDENTGDILSENVVVTIANDTHVIRKPTPNPLWHQRTPNIAAALIQVSNSVWGVAMMDAGTKHQKALIELFNLMLDSSYKAVWGINQLREDVLSDPKQVVDGIKWGTHLKVTSALPPGVKVLEPVVTGDVPPEVISIFNLLNQETLTSMMTNDMRMGGQSIRAVKATEVVAAENSITSVFTGMSKNFEEKKIQPELEIATYTVCQNWDMIDKQIFISLFGKERGEQLSQMEPQEVFVNTINGYKFEVFGISLTLRRQSDFRKCTTILQVIGASEPLIEAFLEKYSFNKLLGEILTSMDLNVAKIEQGGEAPANTPAASPAGPAMQQPGGAPGAQPDLMSQVPSAAQQPSALAQVFSEARPSSLGG